MDLCAGKGSLSGRFALAHLAMAGLSSGDPSLEEVGCDTTTFVLVHSPRATLAAATTRFASRARSPATASKRGETGCFDCLQTA